MQVQQISQGIKNRIPIINIKLTYSHRVKKSDRINLKSSREGAEAIREIIDADTINLHEDFYTIHLNQANDIIGVHHVSRGGITGTVADPRIILSTALQCAACAIILVHNHPSGNLQPSKADQEITQKIKNAASYLDIKVLDHLILSEEGYYSFADEGLV